MLLAPPTPFPTRPLFLLRLQTYTLNQPPRPDLPWPYLPPLPAPVDTLVDLALGPGNAPFIAFSEPNGTTHVLRHAALSWRPVGPQRALPAAPFILYPRLALGPQGQPFLCFPDYDAPGAAFAASCMFYDGFTWSYVGELALNPESATAPACLAWLPGLPASQLACLPAACLFGL